MICLQFKCGVWRLGGYVPSFHTAVDVAKARPGSPEGFASAVGRVRPTALRCSVLRPRRQTRYVRCAQLRSNSGDESVLERAARGATSLPLLAAEEAPSELPGHAFAETFQFFDGQANTLASTEPAFALPAKTANGGRARQAVPGRGDFWGGEERRIEVERACAHQYLTRRVCLSEAERSERSELCGATSIRAPQRSRRTRRPPQHEPRPGTACRAAHTPRPMPHP